MAGGLVLMNRTTSVHIVGLTVVRGELFQSSSSQWTARRAELRHPAIKFDDPIAGMQESYIRQGLNIADTHAVMQVRCWG